MRSGAAGGRGDDSVTDLQIVLIFAACIAVLFAYLWLCDRVPG
jgi:hypothetical protein